MQTLITFVRDSPRRLDTFKDLKNEESPTLMKYCPTRWCVRIKSLKTVRDNYEALMDFFDEIMNDSSVDGTITASASAYLHKLKTFDFFYNLNALIFVFERIEILNSVLQKIDLDFMQSHENVKTTMASLRKSRNEDFPKVWNKIKENSEKLELDLPVLPRVRKAAKRHDSDSSPHVFANPEELYRKRFFEILDHSVTALATRFQSGTMEILNDFESFAIKKTESPEKIMSFYKTENFDADRLTLHRDMIYDLMKNDPLKYGEPKSLGGVVKFLRENLNTLQLVPEMKKLICILLTIPTSTCTCERSFSALRRLKTWIRNMLTAERLNHLSILNVHRDLVSKIDIDALMDEFISRHQVRMNTFAR